MKLIVVAPIDSSREIGFSHALMFHGYFPTRKTDRDPYGVHRNVFLMPDVFSPSGACGEWVVSEALKHKFKGFRGAEFKEVTFTRLIDVPWQVGESIQIPSGVIEDDAFGGGLARDKFFAAFPLAAPPQRKVGRYYLLSPPCAYIECKKRRYRGAKPVFFDLAEPAWPNVEVARASDDGHPLSVKMMEDFPVVYNDGYLFFTEVAFRLVEPHLDMRFFLKGELVLGR